MSTYLPVFAIVLISLAIGYAWGKSASKPARSIQAEPAPTAEPGRVKGELTILNAVVGKDGIERVDAQVQVSDGSVLKVRLAGAMADFLVTYLAPLSASDTFSTYADLAVGEAGEVLDLRVSFE